MMSILPGGEGRFVTSDLQPKICTFDFIINTIVQRANLQQNREFSMFLSQISCNFKLKKQSNFK